VSTSRRRTLVFIGVALVGGIVAGVALGLSDGDDQTSGAGSSTTVASTNTEETAGTGAPRPEKEDDDPANEPNLPRTEEDPQGLEPGPSGPAPSSSDEVEAAEAARSYVEAIDDRDGGEVCDAFESSDPDELLDLPERRGSCPASFEASFGFKGKDGQPVWANSEMTDDVSAEIEGDSARVVATVFTKYADVREPTIEDDIIYLLRATDEWRVIKPSSTIYRAVGIANVPLDAIKPPS